MDNMLNKLFMFSIVVLALTTNVFCDECDENSSNCVRWINEPAVDPIKWDDEGDEGGYVEQVTIRVLDEKGRVVQGALVNITWEITKARGKATTKTLETNEKGRVSFTLTNLEFDPQDIDKTYDVKVKYGTSFVQRTYSAINGKVEQTVVLPVYEVKFLVRDKELNPIPDVKISVGSRSATTSKGGVAYIVLEPGDHSATPHYADLNQQVPFTIANKDVQVNITLELFTLTVKTIDEFETPLVTQVSIADQSKQTDEKGIAVFENLTTKDAIIYATYKDYRKTEQTDLSRIKFATLVFDYTPPQISAINAKRHVDGNLLVQATVKDLGEYASGLSGDNASVVIIYFDSQDQQRMLPMYLVGYELYEGIIPMSQEQASVRYSIYAVDVASNSVSSSEIFVTQNDKKEGFDNSDPDVVPEVEIEYNEPIRLDWAFVPIMVAVLVVIAVVGYWYYNNRKPPSVEKENKYKTTETTQIQNSTNTSSLDTVPKKDEPPKPPSVPQ